MSYRTSPQKHTAQDCHNCINHKPALKRYRTNESYCSDYKEYIENIAAKEVQKAKLPILFIHGDKDTFVPCSMCDELYASCASQKTKLIVKGAGHCESYYKNTKAFEDALDKFLEGVMR